MDSLKTLMDKKNYNLVLSLTENSKDTTHLFYRISAYVALNKLEDALKVIKENRKILEEQLSTLAKFHIEVLCLMNRFDEAYDTLDYYKQLPYINQETEEALADLPQYIRFEEKRSYGTKNVDDEQIRKGLLSDNMEDCLVALDIASKLNYLDYIKEVKKVLISHPKQSIRSFALMMLTEKQHNEDLTFKSHKGDIIVNPSKLTPPFIGDDFNNITKKIQLSFKDASLSETAISSFSSHLIYIYPNKFDYDPNIIVEALRIYSSRLIKQDKNEDIEEICLQKGLRIDDLKDALQELEESQYNF